MLLEWYDEYWAHCGPYGTVDEAAEHLADDLRRVQQEYGTKKKTTVRGMKKEL